MTHPAHQCRKTPQEWGRKIAFGENGNRKHFNLFDLWEDVYKRQDERFVDEHTLTTSISRIRSKIESDGGAPYIKTVYGMGYQWTGGEAK